MVLNLFVGNTYYYNPKGFTKKLILSVLRLIPNYFWLKSCIFKYLIKINKSNLHIVCRQQYLV